MLSHCQAPRRQRDRRLDGTRLTERQLRNEQEQAASALVQWPYNRNRFIGGTYHI